MRRATLIHWRPEEAEDGLARIRAAGWEARCLRPEGGNLKPLREDPPEAFVIDLTRLPSTGRDVAQVLRMSAATRHVPIVFAGGEPEKVAKVREVLPDAVYCDWSRIAEALHNAVATMPDEPIIPQPMAGYSGRPLAKKFGIKAGSRLCLIGAPQGFTAKLSVPEGVQMRERASEAERVLWFIRSMKDMESGFARAGKSVAEKGGLWVIWPKKTSGIETDVSVPTVRAFCMERGWVDYKICAVDETWSGLLFSRRVATR